MEKILIIDDEITICTSLTFALEDRFTVRATIEPEEALGWLEEETFHLCLLDLRIGDVDGLEVLAKLKDLAPDLVVLMMTAYGSIESTVKAIKKGAYSYLTKPLQREALMAVIEQALEYQRLNRQVEYLTEALSESYSQEKMVGTSPPMQRVFRKLEKLKDVDANVLIMGESGTGKELAARALHFSGSRKKHRFVAINCAAIPEALLESELFGHGKGAFSGAVTEKIGKFEYAQKGTLFLDEIGDMPLGLQAKLLRVLQQREITPLGSNKTLSLDVRVVAATNMDLDEAVSQGTFRQDLYYRLKVVTIHLPPLREIPEDLPLLIRHFLNKLSRETGEVKKLSEEALFALKSYAYPGNVRELENILSGAVALAEGAEISLSDLPREVKGDLWPQGLEGKDPYQALVGKSLEAIEAKVIEATLKSQEGHRQKTAKILGISERGLRNKIKRLGLL